MGPTPTEQLQAPDGPLVTGDWLQANLDNPRVQVLDVRGRHPSSSTPHAKRAEYTAGHIPGAIFVDWERDFVDSDDPVPVQVAGAGAFGARAGALGVGDGVLVITYDDYYGIFASRVAWAFRYYGAEARVLDGGWTTWMEDSRPVSDESVELPPARFKARFRPRLRRTLAEVQEALAPGAALVDARPRHLFRRRAGRGEHRPYPWVALPSLPGAGRRRDRTVGRPRRSRKARARCPDRSRSAAQRADRNLR
jgi:thiosulfate/3-mercaptopyruvate sulfurtransferase